MADWCRLRIRQGAKGSQSPQLRAFSLALVRSSSHPPFPLTHFHITDRRRDPQNPLPHPTVLLRATSNGFVWVATRVPHYAHGPVSRQKEPGGESQGPRILHTLPPSRSVVVQNGRSASPRHWREVAGGAMGGIWSASVLLLIVQLFEFMGVARSPGTYSLA
jgi:hypothetical protein